MRKVALLIDGGNLRALAYSSKRTYNPDLIERVAHSCIAPGEELLRVLYYDCAPHTGTTKLPVSGDIYEFKGSDAWLRELACRDLFAIRLGILKFRGWKPKRNPPIGGTLTDEDFKPDFEQKGVDMRIGLDIATLASTKAVERVVLITADTDFIPAMKHARIGGLQVVAVELPNGNLTREFLAHVDMKRPVDWPA